MIDTNLIEMDDAQCPTGDCDGPACHEPPRHIFGVLADTFFGMALEQERSVRQRVWCNRIGHVFDTLHVRHVCRVRAVRNALGDFENFEAAPNAWLPQAA